MIRGRIRRGPELASTGFTIAWISFKGKRFEILVNADKAFQYKAGKQIDILNVLAIDEIFSDAKKGIKAPSKDLMECFQTQDTLKIAERILKDGELSLTTEQRRKLIEDKKKQIIDFLCKHCIDPVTKLPHPPLRIQQAMKQCKVSIDPFKEAKEQAMEILKLLKKVLPIKTEEMRIEVRIPAEYATKSYGVVKEFGRIVRDEWNPDGSWTALIELPVGLHTEFLNKLAKIAKNYQVKVA